MRFKSLAVLGASMLIVGAGCGATPVPAPVAKKGPPGVVCTMEAKLCPDGSYVSRTGPNCEFAPCPSIPNK